MSFDGRLPAGVVEAGNFVRAAEAPGMIASGVSRAVARLEARLVLAEHFGAFLER